MGKRFTSVPSESSIGVSLGTAVALGLTSGRVAIMPTTAYLLVGASCQRECSFCAQARSRPASVQLGRVHWPAFPIDDVLQALRARGRAFAGICLQAVVKPGWYRQLKELVRALVEAGGVPVHASAYVRSVGQLCGLFEAGLSDLGFGVDAATPELCSQHKGEDLSRLDALIRVAARDFPGHISVHLIAGLGESELDMALAVRRYHELGVRVALFALYPVPGTRLGRWPSPPLAAYRRVQLVHWLLTTGRARMQDLEFSPDGQLVGLNEAVLPEPLELGEAFRTSGCPGCNRPFYNEGPAGPWYNYPRPLNAAEVLECLAQAGLPVFAAARREVCAGG